MKFYQKVLSFKNERRMQKLLLTMKLTWFLSLFLYLSTSASVWSQTSKISVKVTDKSLQELLVQIEDNSQYRFFYNNNDIDVSQRVTVDVEDQTIGQILTSVFDALPYSFKEMENNVILIERSKTVTNGKGAQQDGVSGKITDAGGLPLPGVAVMVKGTTNGTVTNIDGVYNVTGTTSSDVLVFSFVGMKSQEIAVGNQAEINVTMLEETIGLDEVVAIGYGTTKKKDVTGSIVNVGVDEMGDRPVASVSEALQGMVPGVTVSNTGGPDEEATVRIRGLSTLNSEGPLWIVDGVINDNGVSPNEIESMTVLKDASAAIYGTRAAAGVILVTTKSGKKGLKVSLDVKYGWSQPWKKLDALNAEQYCDLYTQVYENSGQTVPALLSDSYFRTTRTNWMDEIFRTATNEDYSLMISGGSDKSTFSVFANWKVNNGTLHNTFSKNGRIRIKSDHKINDRIKVGENVSVTTGQSRGVNTTSGYSGAILSAIYYPPSAKVWSDKANGIYSGVVDPNDVDVSLAGQFGDLLNPYAMLDRLNGKNPNINALVNAYVELKIIDGLKFKSNISYNYSQNYNKVFVNRVLEPGKVYDYNELQTDAGVDKSLVAEQLLTYENTFGKHRISALAGYTAEEYEVQGFGTSARDFLTEAKWAQEYINAGDYDTNQPYSSYGDNSLVSVLGRVAYTYADKYYLTGVIRRDGTSKVTKDYRWGTFPSVSLAWRMSEEEFMQDIDFIDDLKVRGSWGRMGNISPLGNYEFDVTLTGTNVLAGADPIYNQAYYMNGISNDELKWETTTTTDVGFDAYMLDSKLTVSADYYNKKVTDMLVQPALIDFAGVDNAPWINVGEVQNKGFEFMVGWNDKAGDFNYGVSFNVSHNKNELVKYTNDKDFEVHSDHVRSTLYPFRSEVGQPLYSYYLIKTDGIFQTDGEAESYTKDGQMIQPNAKAGDLKFVDYNNDGKIDSEDKQFCGDYYPDFTYGLNFSMSYKNWDCNLFLQGVQNVDIFAGYKLSTYQPTQGYNLVDKALNAWSETNTGSDIPKLQLIDSNRNYSTESDWYLEDGSYLRLKNLTIGYTLPTKVNDLIGTSKVRLFFTGQNLLTLTKYDGFDPEVGSNGLDMMKYPQSRTFMFGANINF